MAMEILENEREATLVSAASEGIGRPTHSQIKRRLKAIWCRRNVHQIKLFATFPTEFDHSPTALSAEPRPAAPDSSADLPRTFPHARAHDAM